MKKIGFLLLLGALILGACSSAGERKGDSRFVLAKLGNDVSFHTELQQAYLDAEDLEDVPLEADGTEENSLPDPVKLTWTSSEAVSTFVVGLGEKEDLSDQKEYLVDGMTELDVYNLKIGTKYYWTVKEKDSSTVSETASFTIRDKGPRNLRIPGMTNCRDVGGYRTSNGGRVKQGRIFRTGRSDDITEEGKKVIAELGIRTEIDLRETETKESSPAGEEIRYEVFKMYYDDYANYVERNCESAKAAFRLFAHEENYPLFYHCKIGTDRTGFMTYLLLGLLGVDLEDIQRDYLFSNFGNIGERRTLHGSGVNNVQLYYDAINAFPGENLQEKVYDFLIGIGLTAEELDAIIDLNIEGGKDVEVWKGLRPLTVAAESFSHSDGIAMESYSNLNSRTRINYYPLSEKPNEYVEASFHVDNAIDSDIYCYLYAPTKNLSTKLCDAFSLEVDDQPKEVRDRTLYQLHCRNSAGTYVCVKFTEAILSQGDHDIRLTNIAGGSNKNAYGAQIASIVVMPVC